MYANPSILVVYNPVIRLTSYFAQKDCVFTFCKRLSLPLGKLRTFALFKLPMLLWGTL